MKANEFVKLVGWGRAKQHIKAMDIQNWHNDFYNNLKRLIESHDLVESYGSLSNAKTELKKLSILRWIDPKTERLREAIADVESCMEGL